ncbi:flavodoxin family protein [Desulfatirhabdium butyrativorans]|uniref:flavodoxin family protein n=1 Tax=Desulfatirhabdium butyrativorans TaxID=340467 RepID=UPI00041124EC|nr:flavodoxin family protein [Desulfatirhabdium butyrativorans]
MNMYRKSEEMMKPKIAAIFGSPRRNGNTAALLNKAVSGATDAGAEVTSIVLRDLRMSPCLEIYGCRKNGRCVIEDDFHAVSDLLLASDGIMLASPIFFYTVSSHTKILMDRCQSLWVKKYWIEKQPFQQKEDKRKGLFISAGATQGKKLFDGVLLTVKYFFDAIDTRLDQALCYRGLDFEGDVLKYPAYLDEAYQAGGKLARDLPDGR